MEKRKHLTISIFLMMFLALAGPFLDVSAHQLEATAPGLGAAAVFSILGKAGVTNTGNSVLSRKVGADSSIIGFPPGLSAGKVLAPAVNGAEASASTAFNAMAAQGTGTTLPNDLVGQNLTAGVYTVPGVSLLSGTLTLNGPGVYIFLTDGLTVSGNVALTNGARACDVFWHDASSVSFTGGSFVGNVIALTAITFGNGVSLDGRAFALNASTTLINDHIFGPSCAAPATATATTGPGGPTSGPGGGGSRARRATGTPLIGLPNTGGAPIRNQDFPWTGVVIFSSFSAIVVVLGIRAYRRSYRPKQ